MESYVLAGISMLILIPILYFLPMGFTLKGKVFVVFSSLLIGIFGLISVAVFPVWQTALILLLLVSSLTYLMSKRNQEWMYVQEVEIDPFSIDEEVEEEESQKLDIKPSYTYIAVSEKNPKGNLAVETEQVQGQLGLLEKLTAQSQGNHSLISKEKAEQSFGEHELEELILDIMPPDEKNKEKEVDPDQIIKMDKPETEGTVGGQQVNFTDVDSDIEAIVHNQQEEVADPDIKAIIHKTEEIAEEAELAQNQQNDSHQYISELEQEIEMGEIDLEEEASLNDVPLPTVNVEEILESDEELETENNINLEATPPFAWLNDEFELEEIESAENQKDEVVNEEKEKEKHKPAVEDNTMVKQ